MHAHTHTHTDLLQASWRQLEVLGVQDREKASLGLWPEGRQSLSMSHRQKKGKSSQAEGLMKENGVLHNKCTLDMFFSNISQHKLTQWLTKILTAFGSLPKSPLATGTWPTRCTMISCTSVTSSSSLISGYMLALVMMTVPWQQTLPLGCM